MPNSSEQTGAPPAQRIVSPFDNATAAPQTVTQRKVPLVWARVIAAVLPGSIGVGFAFNYLAGNPY